MARYAKATVQLSLSTADWLLIGLREGKIAPSPYAIRDMAAYNELTEKVETKLREVWPE